MGYFSNGTEGMIYEERYCVRCVHYGDGATEGCAIWFAHLAHNGDDPQSEVLDLLIPRNAAGENQQCELFLPASQAPLPL